MKTIKRPLSIVAILIMLINIVPNVLFSPNSVSADTTEDNNVLYVKIKEGGKDYSYFRKIGKTDGAIRVDYMVDSQGNPVLCLEFDKDVPTEKIKYTKGGELSHHVQYIVEAFHGKNNGKSQMTGDTYKKYFIAQNAIRLVLGQIDKLNKSELEGFDMGHRKDTAIADNINKLADMAKNSKKPAKPSLESSLAFTTNDLTFTQGQDGNYYTGLTSVKADSTGTLKDLNVSVNNSKVSIVNENGKHLKNVEPNQKFKLKLPSNHIDGNALSVELKANANFKLEYPVPIKWITTNKQYQSVTGYDYEHAKHSKNAEIKANLQEMKGSIEGLKVGSDSKKLDGVKVGLFNTKGDKIAETVTKDGGKFSFTNVDYGKAVVKEIAGVDGYVVSNKEYPIEITKDGQVVRVEIENKRIKGAVAGLKVGSDGKKLDGVKVGLFNTKGDKTAETVTKDGGKFSFTNVDYGKAVVKEIASVDGYVVSNKEYPIEITKDGQVVKVEIENKRIKGAAAGLKVGSDGKKLNGVKAGLFNTKGDKTAETVTKDGQADKVKMENEKEVEVLPKTGDTSGALPILLGTLFIAFAGMIIFISKRKKKKEA
ncbi:prealbumin-like fold domain-containing protein [Virgibacillus proomii]|uniref:prealbumin-like fold domain-containing protein n=1 Tax=Virgibacillus proomii TaxID=84407 RepID=UPI0009849315|nr:prealbumin-like fold domain-containing protein [Virgibacillus proomii]